MLVFLDCVFFSFSSCCLKGKVMHFCLLFFFLLLFVFEMHFMFVYISVEWFNCLCSFFFLVPLYRWSTLLKLDFVVCCVINFLFFSLYVCFSISTLFLFVICYWCFFFRASLRYCTLKKKENRTIEYIKRKHIEIYALG